MTFDETRIERWSPAGQIMAGVLVTEIVLAIALIVHSELHRPRLLVAATALAIGSTMVAARSRMPVQPKALLIAALCAALLSLASAMDPFGLRAIDRTIEDATREDHMAAAPIETTGISTDGAAAASQIALRGRGSADAVGFATDLADNVASRMGGDIGPYRVEGDIDISTGSAGDTYRLTWRLGGAGDTRWCGRIVATGQLRAAVIDSFGTTIAAALRNSRDGKITCG